MTVAEIIEAQATKNAQLIAQFGEHTTLTADDLNEVTDSNIDVLNTVNPTANYPTVGR